MSLAEVDAMGLVDLLNGLDARGGVLTIRPRGIEIFLPDGVGWAKHSLKKRDGESSVELIARALGRWL